MKTTFIFTTLLVVAIQVMVNGQTQNNKSNSLTPTVKRGSLNITKVSPNPEPVLTEKTEEAIKKITTINSKIEELNMQLVELQKMKIQVNDEIIAFFDAANNGKKQAVASSIPLNIKREHLIKQAEEMLESS
jgi:TolA-binding protein